MEKTNYLEKEVNSLKGELNYMHQDKLRNNLIIQSIPKLKIESLEKVVPAIAKSLNVNCNSTEYTVNQIFTKKKTNLLLVKFNSLDLKLKFMKAIKSQGLTTDQIGIVGKSRKVFFTNHLTYYNLDLLQKSQVLKKEHQFEFIWFQGGVVLARKQKDSQIYRIKTVDDISTAIKQASSIVVVESEDEQFQSPIQSRNNIHSAEKAGGSKE